MTACEMGCTDIVSFLVDASADVNIQNKVSKKCSQYIVHFQVSHLTNVTAVCINVLFLQHGQTALMIAIETCLEETAQELLGCAESKIDLYAEDAVR